MYPPPQEDTLAAASCFSPSSYISSSVGSVAAKIRTNSPTMAAAHLQHEWRGAMALNNIGVTLLEQSCYKQALETLEDAVYLMKSACQADIVQPQQSSRSILASEVEERIHRGFRRLAKPEPNKTRGGGPRESFLTFSSDDADSFSSAASLSNFQANHSSGSHSAILIRMEDLGTEDGRIPEIDSAIMLQNYGLSCLSASNIVTRRCVRSQLRNSAIDVLTLCQNILCTAPTLSMVRHNPLLLQKVYFVAVVSTSSMARILSSSAGNRSVHTIQCEARLSDLQAALLELDVPELSGAKAKIASAA